MATLDYSGSESENKFNGDGFDQSDEDMASQMEDLRLWPLNFSIHIACINNGSRKQMSHEKDFTAALMEEFSMYFLLVSVYEGIVITFNLR
jgi:hypothetical protein